MNQKTLREEIRKCCDNILTNKGFITDLILLTHTKSDKSNPLNSGNNNF